MCNFIYVLVAFFSAVITALLLLPWVLKRAYATDMYNLRNRAGETRRGVLCLGGSILTPGVLIGMTLVVVLRNEGEGLNASFKYTTLLLGCGVMLVYLVGLLDDIFGLSARLRFCVQLMAAATLPLSDVYFHSLHGLMGIETMPVYAGMLLTVLFVVTVINAVNMIDGIDGLISVYVMMCLTCFGYCFWEAGNLIYIYIAAAMAGGLSVFFFYNMFGTLEKRTKTYMGDSGSMMLGFSLAYLAVKFISCEHTSSLSPQWRMLLCISLLFIPCMDLCRVVLERLLHGEHPFVPDKRHIHYRLMAAGIFGRLTLLCVMSVVVGMALMNLGLGISGLSLTWILAVDVSLYILLMSMVEHRVRIYRNTMASKSNIRERFRENAMHAHKICILTPRFPVPENGGDVLRINNIARQLKREGYELILVSFEDDGSPQLFEAGRIYDKVYTVHRNRINSLWQSFIHLLSGRAMQCGYYYSASYRHLLHMVMEKEQPDLYIAHLLRMMPYLDEARLHDRSIIEMTDALSKTYSLSSGSKGNWILKHVYCMERYLIRRTEQYSMMHFPVNVLVSEADADYLKTISPHNAGLVVHTNGVDVISSPVKKYDCDKIVFVGNMRTLQNQDAVYAFVQDVFPRILKRIPAAKFYIVGAQPPQEIQDLASDHIIVTGFVDDLTATIRDAAVAVAPVRVAAGIQNKVLVAMGCGLPVVLTTLISRAIPELEDDINCIIRDEAATIADSCIRLMRHPEERNALARAGYDMVCRYYGWEEKLRGYVVSKGFDSIQPAIHSQAFTETNTDRP